MMHGGWFVSLIGLVGGIAAVSSSMTRDASAGRAPVTLQPERIVDGQTLASERNPTANLRFADRFRYVGGQRFLLHGMADAEQHFFVDADGEGRIRRLYWVQFEHYLPGREGRYDYSDRQQVEIGGLSFAIDTKVFADYGTTVFDPNAKGDSDQARAGTLLRGKGFMLPTAAARTRMFHLPNVTHRSELMIIYAEEISAEDFAGHIIPAESAAENKWPDLARQTVEHARDSLSIVAPSLQPQ
jgi:hypothetical protein